MYTRYEAGGGEQFQMFTYSECYTYALCVTNDFPLLLLHLRAAAARMCLSGTAAHGNPNREVLGKPKVARLTKIVPAVTGTQGFIDVFSNTHHRICLEPCQSSCFPI